MSTVRSACPLNCPDGCSFLVEVTDEGIRVHGDMQSMGTGGFICPKGRALGDMVYSPDRLRFPLLKKGKGWKRISWEEAYDILAEKIKQTLNSAGSQAILHMFDNGHNGVLRKLDRRFFQALGGVTEPRGSMCWGAGIKAQEKDFGAVYSSDWEEMLNSKTIILWGRDPAVTNKHLIPLLRQAADKGVHIIVINPIRVKSTAFAHEYIRVNPATDGILALGIAHFILRERWMDFEFVRDFATNFGPYAALVKEYPPEKVEEITGVPVEKQEQLARRITHNRPVMFYLGYGLQRYINGGKTVRAIDALAAISGNLGCPGAGVFYAHQYHTENLNTLLLPEEEYTSRTFPHATMSYELLREDLEPKIQLAFVTRTNPLVTEPDSVSWRELWNKIPFKVVFDMWMSQTASLSDLVLPITTIFEEEDLIATSWSNRIHYAQKVLDPLPETKPEPEIFTELARRLGLKKYFPYTSRQWLEYIIEPLKEWGITLDTLKKGPIKAPYIPKVAWEDKKFLTPSGKIELITRNEFYDGAESFVENYFAKRADKNAHNNMQKISQENNANLHENKSKKIFYLDDYKEVKRKQETSPTEYPYILLTPHPDLALHSQFQADEGFTAFIHPDTAEAHHILPGDKIIVESENGDLVATAYVSEDIHVQTVVIPEGTTENYLGINRLIAGKLSDLGESTSYFDTFCQIRKWHID